MRRKRKKGKFSNFEEWEPYYREILDYFSFDRAKDEEAALMLQTLLERDDLPVLESLIRDRQVTVCGNAPCLVDELHRLKGTVLAADAASLVLEEHGVLPDAIFTDLDGATEMYEEMNENGVVLVVHAHGDNMPLLRYWVPRFRGPLVGTTQARPLEGIYNFGGFSDGDRPVFTAHALGAEEVTILGFDLDDVGVNPVKRGKLIWARKLLKLIGHEL
ncbi:MAG: DUF115 domain-containing protein [Methanomicrobiales archaeon]|nr:DUF115 domain-containing protein [Methanomicrobiales archaeon]